MVLLNTSEGFGLTALLIAFILLFVGVPTLINAIVVARKKKMQQKNKYK